MDKLFKDIPSIMERFEFEKVAQVMAFLNWRWGGRPVTVDMLRSQAYQLLDMAILDYEKSANKHIGYSVATGGLIAEVVTFANAEPELSLLFYVDHRQSL